MDYCKMPYTFCQLACVHSHTVFDYDEPPIPPEGQGGYGVTVERRTLLGRERRQPRLPCER